MNSIEKTAKKLFDPSISERERAIFEGGVALGSLYHQFIGVPIVKEEKIVKTLEEAMANAIRIQPYRESVEVKINPAMIESTKRHVYDYETLKGRHLEAKVVAKYGKARAVARMRYVPEIDYTLMYIEKVE